MGHQPIGNWVVDEVLDQRTPQIFLCHHTASPEIAAMVEVLDDNPSTRENHRRIIDAMKQLRQRHVPDLLDFGIDPDNGQLWRAWQVHRGERLSDLLNGEPMDWRDVCAIFHQIAQALESVHVQGFAHRDLHPGRIVVGPSGAWLTGFDYALTAEALAKMAAAPIGNMAYLAPEVIADPSHHGPRADLYAFGVVLYEALTGRAAFPAAAWGERADSATRMLEWKTRTAALDPSEHVEVPEWLANLVRKATDPSPDRRLPDIESLLGWLDAATPAWISDPRKLTSEPAQPRAAAPPTLTLTPPSPSITQPSPSVVLSLPAPQSANNNNFTPQLVLLLELTAAVLGVVTGMAFSSLVVVFVELTLRA